MRLKELRKANNLTQQEIANILKISQQSYNGYETNKFEPNISILFQLADYYGVSLDYLCEHTTENQIPLGCLTDTQKIAINLLLQLHETNLLQTIGYITSQIQNQ